MSIVDSQIVALADQPLDQGLSRRSSVPALELKPKMPTRLCPLCCWGGSN